MAGASMNGIKSRIKSVQSTMQITKAMELVATSKLRRAKERVERARPYYEILGEAVRSILTSSEAEASVWSERESGKTLYVVVAGDRGLAGGYNANIFKLTEKLAENGEALIFPIGKKALEYYRHRNADIFSSEFCSAADIGVGEAINIASAVCEAFCRREITRVVLVYTKFVSMLTQLPVYEELLPLALKERNAGGAPCEPVFDGEPAEMLEKVMPEYIAGAVYFAICEASASESGARRTSMNAANKNAEEMIASLTLKYNRARQAVITQEITEIVSGAEAL